MALGPCRTCGTLVEWTARGCPNCGDLEPIDVPWKKAQTGGDAHPLRDVVTMLVLVVVILSLVALCAQAESWLEPMRDQLTPLG